MAGKLIAEAINYSFSDIVIEFGFFFPFHQCRQEIDSKMSVHEDMLQKGALRFVSHDTGDNSLVERASP